MRIALVTASLVALVGALGAAALLAGSAPSFARARSYAIGSNPVSVAIGDLNGDGKPDVATANTRASSVSVLLNKGDGSFQGQLELVVGNDPVSIAIGDLNGDGRPDLATANGDVNGKTVSILLNRGGGGFAAKVDYETGQDPESVAMGDLNGDGKRDLVTANYEGYTLSVFLNRGDGSFEGKVDYEGVYNPTSVAIGDLNGDGKPDLAAVNFETSTVTVLLNRATAAPRRPGVSNGARSHPRSPSVI